MDYAEGERTFTASVKNLSVNITMYRCLEIPECCLFHDDPHLQLVVPLKMLVWFLNAVEPKALRSRISLNSAWRNFVPDEKPVPAKLY